MSSSFRGSGHGIKTTAKTLSYSSVEEDAWHLSNYFGVMHVLAQYNVEYYTDRKDPTQLTKHPVSINGYAACFDLFPA